MLCDKKIQHLRRQKSVDFQFKKMSDLFRSYSYLFFSSALSSLSSASHNTYLQCSIRERENHKKKYIITKIYKKRMMKNIMFVILVIGVAEEANAHPSYGESLFLSLTSPTPPPHSPPLRTHTHTHSEV